MLVTTFNTKNFQVLEKVSNLATDKETISITNKITVK